MSIFSVGKRVAPKKQPWLAPDITNSELMALKALAAGTANDEQQQAAIRYIVFDLCGTYDWACRPGDHDGTMIASGKQWVGQRLVHLIDVQKVED